MLQPHEDDPPQQIEPDESPDASPSQNSDTDSGPPNTDEENPPSEESNPDTTTPLLQTEPFDTPLATDAKEEEYEPPLPPDAFSTHDDFKETDDVLLEERATSEIKPEVIKPDAVAILFKKNVKEKQPIVKDSKPSFLSANPQSVYSHRNGFKAHKLVCESGKKFWFETYRPNPRPNIFEPSDVVYLQKGSRRVVFFDGKFHEISNINLKDETFDGRFRMYLVWLASEGDVKSYNEYDKESKEPWQPSWQPSIELDNFSTNSEREIAFKTCKIMKYGSSYSWLPSVQGNHSKLDFDARFGVFIRAMYEVGGTFVEEFELQSFPFDCQDLKVVMRCTNCPNVVPLPTDAVYLSVRHNRMALADFQIKNLTGEFGRVPKLRSSGKNGEIILVVKVERYWQSRLDVLLSEGVLTFLSLLVFALEPAANPNDGGDLGNRVNYLMTLILTDVALQQYAKDKLNDFEYLTALDKFIWASFGFKCLVLVWVAIPFFPLWFGNVSAFADVYLTNLVATWVFTILFFVYIICCVAYFSTISHIERRKLSKSVLEIDQEFNENRMENYECTLNDRIIKNFCRMNASRAPLGLQIYPRRLVQQSNVYSADNDLDVRDELHIYSLNHIAHDDIVFELVGRKGVLVFAGLIALSMWALNNILSNAFQLEAMIMFVMCVCGNLVNWAYTTVCRSSIRDRHESFTYYHNYWLYLSIVIVSLHGIANHSSTNRRAVLMNGAVCGWYLALVVFDVVYDSWNMYVKWWGKQDRNERTDRFVMKYVRVYSRLPESDDVLELTTEYVLLFVKHLVLGVNQGVRAFVMMLPIFVVQHDNARAQASNPRQKSDSVGIAFFAVSCALLLLSFIFRDSLSVWKDKLTFTKIVSKMCPCICAATPEDEAAEHMDGDVDLATETDAASTDNSPLPSLLGMVRNDSALTDENDDDDSDGDTDEVKNRHKSLTSYLNPFRVIRHPIRVSEMWLWVSMWVISVIVYERGFLIGIIGILSPVYVVLYHALLIVPLLEYFGDDEFGEKDGYQEYKDSTTRFFIQL